MITEDQLSEILACANATTPGEWYNGPGDLVWAKDRDDEGSDIVGDFMERVDAEFTARAHKEVPALVDEITRLRGKLAEIANIAVDCEPTIYAIARNTLEGD